MEKYRSPNLIRQALFMPRLYLILISCVALMPLCRSDQPLIRFFWVHYPRDGKIPIPELDTPGALHASPVSDLDIMRGIDAALQIGSTTDSLLLGSLSPRWKNTDPRT